MLICGYFHSYSDYFYSHQLRCLWSHILTGNPGIPMRKLIPGIILVLSLTISAYADSEETKSYKAWRESHKTVGEASAYFLPNLTILCLKREYLVRAYNDLVVNGQGYSRRDAEGYGCQLAYGWSIARIMKQTTSNVVQVQYWESSGKFASRRWTHGSFLTQLDEYRAWLRKRVVK